MTKHTPPISDREKQRNAGSSILGYRYQFLQSIAEIMNDTSESVIMIEGVEDIDLIGRDDSTAVQVKYLSSKKYTNPTTLRDPIFQMLKSFKEGRQWNYRIYVHFGENSELVPKSLEPDQILESLTIIHNKDNSTAEPRDAESRTTRLYEGYEPYIAKFSEHLAIESGPDIETLEHRVIRQLSNSLNCTIDDATEVFLGIAFNNIHKRACSAEDSKRQVRKKEFIYEINRKDYIFARWFREERGGQNAINRIKNRLSNRKFGTGGSRRGLILNFDEINLKDNLELARAVTFPGPKVVQTRWTPWTIICQGNKEIIQDFKRLLIRDNIFFSDGYEEIEFSLTRFQRLQIKSRTPRSDYLDDITEHLKIISLSNFLTHEVIFSQSWKIISINEVDFLELPKNIEPVKITGLPVVEIAGILEGFR